MIRIIAIVLLAMLATPASAQIFCPDPYSARGACTPLSASSGNVAAGVATATLAGAAAKTTYLCGFSITSSGSTGALVVSPTVANTITGTMTFSYTTVAGVTLANATLNMQFNPCIPANGTNVTVPVSLPSLGAGNTNATVNAWGYQL